MSKSSESSDKRKNVFSEWLETLQQESWQLELLISGLALFGIWESRSILLKFEYYLDSNAVDPYIFYGNVLVMVLWSGWGIFLVNLLAHIIVRGLWIGAIGLRYVSGDIDYDKLNYSETFKSYFKRRIGSFDDYIEGLEKLSSVLFSFTFLLFFLFFSLVFVNILFGIIASTVTNIFYKDINGPNAFIMIFGGLFYGLGLIVIIDFISLGGFKRVKDKTFSRIYLWIYRFYSTISLSFIYRPLLFNFIDDKYTRRLFFLALPYGVIMLFGVRMITLERYSFIPSFTHSNDLFEYTDKYAVNWNNYDDLRMEYHGTYSDQDRSEFKSSIKIASLNQYELDQDFGKIFLKYLNDDSELLSRQFPDFSIFKKSGLRHRMFSSGRIQDPHLEKLTSSQVQEVRFMLNVVRSQEDKIDSTNQVKFQHKLEEYRNYNSENIAMLRKRITDHYEKLKREYAEQKLIEAKNIIFSNYDITIDNVNYNDSLSCSFFTHPNMQEQGMLCYFSLSALSDGEHLIYIEKIRNKDDCLQDCPTYKKFIPFRKI